MKCTKQNRETQKHHESKRTNKNIQTPQNKKRRNQRGTKKHGATQLEKQNETLNCETKTNQRCQGETKQNKTKLNEAGNPKRN